MSTANTTLLAEVTAIMADVAVDVPGVATAFGRREVVQHQSPPMVGWWPSIETPQGARKNSFPGGRRELYSSELTLTVRCWGLAATPDRTYAATDLEAAMLLRESVLACLQRRWPGTHRWTRATWVTEGSQTDLGESVDLTIVLNLGVLDRAPTRASITTTTLTAAAVPFADGLLQPGETR
jgi:hypothetical protein